MYVNRTDWTEIARIKKIIILMKLHFPKGNIKAAVLAQQFCNPKHCQKPFLKVS